MSLFSFPALKETCYEPSDLDEYGLTPLARAVFDNKIDLIRHHILQGVNLEEPTKFGLTALFIAVEFKRHAIAAILLKAGASYRVRAEADDYSPLHLATALGDVIMAQMLIAYGANIHDLDYKSTSPLAIAAEIGSEDLVRLFIECKVRPQFLPLAFVAAINNCQPSIARLLIEAGADNLKLWSAIGTTPLHGACAMGDKETAAFLVLRGAELTRRDTCEMTPLVRAVLHGQEAVIAHLFTVARASFRVADKDGLTALHDAAHNGLSYVFEELAVSIEELETTPDAAPHYLPLCGAVRCRQLKTALAIAKVAKRLDILDRQVECLRVYFPEKVEEICYALDSTESEEDALGRTRLHYAVLWGDAFFVNELAESCFVDINVVDKEHLATPLAYAVDHLNVIIVDILLKKGARVDMGMMKFSPSGYGCYTSLLQVALVRGHVEIMAKLIAAGANANEFTRIVYKEANGTIRELMTLPITPLLMSLECVRSHRIRLDQAYELMKILLDAGADPDIVVAEGKTIKQSVIEYVESVPEYRRLLELFS